MTGKVAMTEIIKAHKNSLVKVKLQERKLSLVIFGMFPSVHNSERQLDANSETSVNTSTQEIC